MGLLDLPRELRDLIIPLTLESDTGLVSIARKKVGRHSQLILLEVNCQGEKTGAIINGALRRTCRQMYYECKKDLVWKLNTVYFYPNTFFQDMKLLPATLKRKIQRVSLQFDLFAVDLAQEFALSFLMMFARQGYLRSITLNTVDPKVTAMANLQQDIVVRDAARRALQCQLNTLKKDGWKHVAKKRLIVDTKGARHLEKCLHHLHGSLELSLEFLSEDFVGETWVDGVLISNH